MTKDEIEAMKAAFLAKGGQVERVPEQQPSYTDAEWAKIVRTQHHGVPVNRPTPEQQAERRMEQVREANHTGGRKAAIEALQGERNEDHTHYE